jgi:hypothetical protein
MRFSHSFQFYAATLLTAIAAGHCHAGLEEKIGQTFLYDNNAYPATRTITQGYNSGYTYAAGAGHVQESDTGKTTISQEGSSLLIANDYYGDGNGSTGEEIGLYIVTRRHVYNLGIILPCDGCREGGACEGGPGALGIVYDENTNTWTTAAGGAIPATTGGRSGAGTCPCGPSCGSTVSVNIPSGPPADNPGLAYAGFLPVHKTLVWSKFYPATPSPNPETTIVPIQDAWYGREIVVRAWKFRRYNHGDLFTRNTNPYISYWPGSLFTVYNTTPSGTFETTTSGTVYRDTAVSLQITVAPPDNAPPDFTYGAWVKKWTGPAGATVGSAAGQWEPASLYETVAPCSGTLVLNITDTPGINPPGTVCYKLSSWETGSSDHEGNSEYITFSIANRPPSVAALAVSGTAIEYGQGMTVTGSLADLDGNLSWQGLWWCAPGATPDYSAGAAWVGKTASGGASTITGTFVPAGTGNWQLHTNGLDAAGAWGPGDGKVLVVNKAVPACTFGPQSMGKYERVGSALLNAVFKNPYNPSAIILSGSTHYTLDGAPVPLGQFISTGTHSLAASYSGDGYHHSRSVEVLLTVIDNAADDSDGDGVPNGIEAALGTDTVTSGGNPGNALGIKHLTPVGD